MKSQVNALLHVTRGLIKDVLAAYPALEGLTLDIEKLTIHCQNRGLNVFTLDLPNLDSLLLQGLETGRLQLSGPFSRRVSKRVQVPRLFSGLWLRVFDRYACLRQEVDVTALFFLRQLCRLGKNIEVECSFDRINAALENYHDVEQRIRKPTFQWESDVFDDRHGLTRCHIGECCDPSDQGNLQLYSGIETPEASEKAAEQGLCRLLDQVQQVADLIIGSMDPFNYITFAGEKVADNQGIGFRHGAGAVAERLRNHEKSCFPNWPAKLERSFPYEMVGITSISRVSDNSDFPNVKVRRPPDYEEVSRLCIVPKTAKGPRIIASEPTSHMWCQQGIRQFLVDQLISSPLRRDFIDFQDQSKSGDLVLKASQDRKLATVDLSDASDRLSCWTVERIFRSNISLLCALHAARTRCLRDDVSKTKSFLKLKKFATQGTAVTFPVQSIVFLCIALGVTLDGEVSWRSIRKLTNQVRIYGDDIILPRYGYARLVRVMEALGLKVNEAKSFKDGHFRESCGTDGFMGHDVTPISPKGLVVNGPESFQAVVDTINNLFNKGLWNASDSLRSLLPPRIQRGLRIVGRNDTGFSGLTSFSGSDESHLVKRWNSRLHRTEVRVWSILDRTPKRDRNGEAALLDFFASKHSPSQARIVSKYGDVRKTRDGFLWESLNSCARVFAGSSAQ